MPPTSAARLREMAREAEFEANRLDADPDVKTGMIGARLADAAALIAGAEALEACAKLRSFADELTAQNMPVLHGMAYRLNRLLPQEPNR